MSELADCYLELGNFASGIALADKTIALGTSLRPAATSLWSFRRIQQHLSDTMAALATMYARIGQPAHAFQLLRQACRESRGSDLARFPMFYASMGDVLAAQGKVQDAYCYYERALGYSVGTAGDLWLATSSRIGYARFLQSQGRLSAAQELLEEVLACLRREENHTDKAHLVEALLEIDTL